MYVRESMNTGVVTVTSDTAIEEVGRLMQEQNIYRFPAVDTGELVGIVTRHDLRSAKPSRATSLSV